MSSYFKSLSASVFVNCFALQEEQGGDPVLDSDDLVVGRNDIFLPERQLVMIVRGVVPVIVRVNSRG